MLTFLHDGAMCHQPTKASASRCLKDLMPALLRWLEAEQQRRSDPADILLATTDIAITAIFTTALNVAPNNKIAAELITSIKDALGEHFDAALTRLRSEGR